MITLSNSAVYENASGSPIANGAGGRSDFQPASAKPLDGIEHTRNHGRVFSQARELQRDKRVVHVIAVSRRRGDDRSDCQASRALGMLRMRPMPPCSLAVSCVQRLRTT